jgi:hypothetical protein
VAESTPTRYWRLSWEEYDHAISSLVGRPVRPSVDARFPTQAEGLGGWLNVSDSLEAGGALASGFETAAVAVAPEIAATLPACGATDADCARALVADVGSRAWRRPLDDSEIDRYTTLFMGAAAVDGSPIATELVVEALLRSPYFLFRSEVGDPATLNDAGEVMLTPHEMASALSFGLWREPPDDALLALAESGELVDPAVYGAEARTMMADDRFVDAFHEFITQLLGIYDVEALAKNPTVFPEFTSRTASAMAIETHALVADILRNEGASFARFMTADHTYPPVDLDWVYGRATDGSRLVDPNRVGLLTQPSFVATHAGASWTSPTGRGLFIVRRLACFDPPPPPPGVDAAIPAPGPNQTTRDAFEAHRSDPGCAGCHGFFDPVGMTFESYDAVGRFRTTENGQPIDPSGELAAGVLGEEPLPLDDVHALGRVLAESESVHRCVTRRAFQYFSGRAESERDQPLLDEAYTAFRESDLDLRELIHTFFASERFRWRQASP